MSDQFVTQKEAAAWLGITEHAMGRRVRRGELTAHRDPTDLRVRLIDLAELKRYARPRPLPRREEVPSPTAA